MFRFFTLPAGQKLFIISHRGIGYEDFVSLKFIAIIISGAVYVTLSLVKIRAHQKKIQNIFSNTEKINLQWLCLLTYGVGIIWLVVLSRNQMLTFAAISLYISAIGFFGIKQVNIFSSNQSNDEILPDVRNPVADPGKHETYKLPDAKKELLQARLKQHIDENKLFLDPDLTLDTLASAIDFHPNYVSQYVNEHLGLSFYDYINSRRIEEFKRKVMLPESKSLNLLGIAFECGFNSKSTFNRNFKKCTGQTPSEYVNSLKYLSTS
jgi:AraC-like DNA-binding protein